MTSTTISAAPPVAAEPVPPNYLERLVPLFAAFVGALLPIVILPNEEQLTFEPKDAIVLLLAAVGIARTAALAIRSRYALTARVGLGFAAVCLLSALISTSPLVGIFGVFGWGEGALFFMALIGAWAIGASLDAEGRRWLVFGLVTGVAANAVVAIVQVAFTLNSQLADQSGFGLFQGTQADGMMGNPIHLEAILLGGMALALGRACRRPWPWAPFVGLCAAALEFSSERWGAILLVGLVAYGLFAYRLKGLYFAVAAALGFVVPLLVGSGVTLTSRIAASTTSSTFTLRGTASLLGIKATLLHAPLFGFGPGEVRNAVNAYGTRSFALKLGPGRYFLDLHDIFSNVLTMTGVVGFVLFLAFLALAGRHARGPFLGFALMALAVELVEPMNLGVTPVAFLCLGAALAATRGPALAPEAGQDGRGGRDGAADEPAVGATPGRRRAREGFRLAELAMGVIALIPAALLLVGDDMAHAAQLDFSLSQARLAAQLVPVWSENDNIVSLIYRYQATVEPTNQDRDLERARQWIDRGLQADLADNVQWQYLATADMHLHDYAAAAAELKQSLALDPLAVPTLASEGQLLAIEGKWSQSIAVLEDAQQLAPADSEIHQAVLGARKHQVTYFTFGTT